MKKSLLCLIALCGAFLFLSGRLTAQEAPKPAAPPVAKPAPTSELGLAADALKKGDEVKAWQLYSENVDQFAKTWAEQDDALAAWVPDQLRKQKRYKECQDLCDLMLAKEGALGPEYLSRVMLTKGDLFKDRENFPAAKLEYQGLEKNKELAKTEAGRKAKFRIIDILRLTKDYETANEMLERLKDSMVASEEAEAYYYSARIAADREDFEAAREFIEEVKRRAPEHVETLFLEGELNLKQDRLQDPELEIGSRVLTTYIVPGRPITMKMQDRNLAIVRGGAGLPVELRTSKSGDREVVMLSPSPRDPTLFRGQLPTRLGEGVTNSMILELTGADIVTYSLDPVFQKQNDLKYPEKKMVVVANADLSATSGDFVSSEERDDEALQRQMQQMMEDSSNLKAYEKPQVRNTSLVRPGNDIRVQVIDADRDMSKEADAVLVDAETSSGDLVTGISLVETNAHAGVFRGKIPTTIAPPMATASDSAAGSNPGAAVSVGDSAGWTSSGDGKKPKWIEVDLMTVQPLVEASATFGPGVKAVTLYGGAGTAKDPKAVVMTRLGSTKPLQEEVHGYVNLARHFGALEKTAAYVCTEFEAPEAGDATFKIGSCDGVVCWLNGERVHMNLGGRMWKPEEDTVKVKLQKGANCVVLRVSQLTGPWGASLTVEDAAGKGLPSIKSYPPAKPGVITGWFLFDRPTPEDIVLPKRVSTDKPVRIGDSQFRWIPVSVIPQAHVTLTDGGAKAVFHTVPGVRRLRWSLDDFEGTSVSVKKLAAKNKFGDAVLPCASDFSTAKGNRQLELGPGDRILVKYNDERNTRGTPQVLTATMNSGFNDAIVELAYEKIDTDADGKRNILYDPAVRYRPGITETLAVRVTDYDADVTDERDRVKVLATTSGGAESWIEAVESEPHSGEFLAVLKLGGGESADAVKVTRTDKVSVSYQDRENGDGHLEKTAVVIPATQEEPEIMLYQALVNMEPAPGGRGGLVPVLKTKLAPKSTNGMPVVTSIDTSLVFSVLYPEGALSQGSTLPAKIITERALEEATKGGQEPKYTDVVMDLEEPLDAVFNAHVALRTGNPEDYADEMAARESTRPTRGERRATPRLYVKADDIVKVIVKGAGQGAAKEGRYRLASDGDLAFMDRKYQETVQQVYVGDYLYIRLTDRDRDLTDNLDSVKVTLTAGTESREISLAETLPHSGVFAGRAKTEMRGLAGAKPAAEGAEIVLPVGYGESIKAVYQDTVSVVASEPRTVTATAHLYPGADGTLATFTKLFADEEIAVKTRLLTAEALFELAKSHRESNQKDLAAKEIAEGKAILEEAIADYPNTSHAPHAEFLLANLAQELEKFEEAITRYDKVVSNWPNSEFASRAMLRKAICQEKLNDFENALDTYVELTYSYPNSPLVSDAVIRLGQYFYRTSKFEVAGKIFSSFQERNPAHDLAAKALFLSGQSYLKGAEERKKVNAGKYDASGTAWLKEGVDRFEKLMDTYDDKDLRSESMYWMADSYMKLNDMKGAYQTFKRLTWDYPETKWAKFARGQLVQNAKSFEKFEMDQD